ncbi:MAG: hybrid sensor histidine kinase/response regulator [Pelomonas sp.]|nr:hybrid sensor histidine kinase/response regulator [Roseateles sp.]
MSLDPKFLSLLRETFRAELAEHHQSMSDGLLELERGLDGEARADVLNSVFRSAHNLKGAARGIEAHGVAELAHHLESVFQDLRGGLLELDGALVDLALKAVDGLRDLALAADEAVVARQQLGLVAELKAVAARGAARRGDGAAHDALLDGPAPGGAPPPAAGGETHEVAAAVPETVGVAADASEAAAPRGAEPTEAVRVPAQRLQRVAAISDDLQLARIAMSEQVQVLQALGLRLGKLEARLGALRPRGRRGQPLGFGSEARTALDDGLPELGALRRQVSGLAQAMRGTLSRAGHAALGLQNEVRLMQLVPVANVLRPLVRMVRDLGRELGKAVELDIRGDQIEVDRAVLDGLRDPLTHLLRNAVDHGIETPEARRAAGKPEQGHIGLDVASVGGRIVIEVHDDGGGMRAERIAEVARARQLVDAARLARMDEQARLELIFLPGFSSKQFVSDISGRGVGLDVVKANLRRLKGSVGVTTRPGQGTRFTLELPLTLAMERGLQLRAGGETLMVPSTSVDHIDETAPELVRDVAASQALLVDGHPVPLRDLAAALQLPQRARRREERAPVVVLARGGHRVAFIVDEVVGEREIVIRRLPPPLHAVPNISGATLTGGGEVVMVLNVDELIDAARHAGGRALADAAEEPRGAERPHVLVVDDSITTRTLEKNMLESQGYRVSVATDGEAGWEALGRGGFALVITDVEMPRLDGFALTARIRASAAHAELPVIIVTSLAKEADRRRGIEVGANAYIVKSDYESRALLDVVRQLV